MHTGSLKTCSSAFITALTRRKHQLNPPVMRTLFLTATRQRTRSLRPAIAGTLLLLFLIALLVIIYGLTGWHPTWTVIIGALLLTGGILLARKWLLTRRMKSDSQNLKDSALW